ncbi:glycerol-3-phosphate 1-O-acyltransferase PlsY [Spiroplasma endosymbiont of Nephrotoma flavescens]|uniref:glycerol-3-phosphate 1-O-acyltransferase PlsY n=1 Tax=Spiroplasma endosymbiont of Nephrotoma flavescens TaxID=3066302 RepID=UPI00313B122B
MSTASIIMTTLGCVIGYLVGSLSPAILISKYYFKTDVRNHYSKNAGATNAARIMGTKFGLIILILDGLKIGLVLAIVKLLSLINSPSFTLSESSVYISAVFVVFGHCLPIYHKFKGGKGVGPFLGFTLFLNPIYFIIATIVWWTIFLTIRIVSIASLICAISIFCCSWITQINNLPVNMWINHSELFFSYLLPNYWTQLIVGLIVLIVILRHYQNIYRIFTGQEKQFSNKK